VLSLAGGKQIWREALGRPEDVAYWGKEHPTPCPPALFSPEYITGLNNRQVLRYSAKHFTCVSSLDFLYNPSTI
jgi:hypothetical protein